MKTVTDTQYQRFAKAMHAIYRQLGSHNQDIDSIFPSGITNAELSTISYVKTHPDAILKEIIEALGHPASTMTSVVSRLVKRGLVQKVFSERNNHSYSLLLTEEGIHISELHEKAEQKMWERILGGLDIETEQETLICLLEKISLNIK